MNKAFLLLGGNLGHREKNLDEARQLLERFCGHITRSSSLYETAAWGKTDQPAFLNQALEIESKFDAGELMTKILSIEAKLGRERTEKYGPRAIDIDILLFNNDQYNSSQLKIPHPEMHKRRFVLAPLAEIAATTRHPVLGRSIAQLLEECTDHLDVRRYEGKDA